jgi:hypothetical protein
VRVFSCDARFGKFDQSSFALCAVAGLQTRAFVLATATLMLSAKRQRRGII